MDSSRLSIPTVPDAEQLRDDHVCYGDFPSSELKTIIHTALTRDPYMRMHLLSVNKMAFILGERARFDSREREVFVRAALLHDVGKILIPDPIIQKPSKLTPEEYQIVKTHVELGQRLVSTEPGFEDVALVVGQHHEWVNGAGYPHGLKGEEIHPLARALSVIDAFSAMTDERPYNPGISPIEALTELEACAGTQFDEHFVQIFVKMKRSRTERGSLLVKGVR